jgi:hypothetical protein
MSIQIRMSRRSVNAEAELSARRGVQSGDMRKLLLPILVLAIALLAAGARADTIVSADPSASNVSAYGGVVAWSQKEPTGGYRLVARVGGVVSALSIPTSRVEFDPDVGPRGGVVVAVYQRCGGPCETYEYSFASGRERKLPSLYARGCHVVGLSAWRGTLAFVRRGDHCRRRALYVRRPGHRIHRLRGVAPVWFDYDTDTDGRVVLFANPADSRIRSIPVQGRRPHKLFHDGAESGDVDVFLRSPTIDGRYAYWFDVEEGEDGNTADLYRALRRSGRGCRRDERDFAAITPPPPIAIPTDDLPLSPDSLAVDRGTVYYARYGVFQADPAPTFAKPSECVVAAFRK